ncbi:MAG: DUF4856 domain-containing protein [Flavobacteriaceae bacterium]|nr:DUF4856 domain-containing protein [Flavobacteriaceae bacterium]|tara:strand:- start:1796 stop:3058 length:1263 start_codon:yes stop_codon:yes gene_type:complete
MKHLLKTLLFLFVLSACEKDPETIYVDVPGPTVTVEVPVETIVEVPVTTTVTVTIDDPVPPLEYYFTRNGVSTVYYTGQTLRLNQHDALKSAMNDTSFTNEQISNMFDNGQGFSDASLNSSKNVGGKTGVNSAYSATNKAKFDAWITEATNVVFPAVIANTDAVAGTPGIISDAGGGSRTGTKVNAKGHEMNQIFSKALIGAFNLDQIINDGGYISNPKLDPVKDDNDNGVMYYTNTDAGAVEANITKMEHYWDEGFGYLYGQDDPYNPVLGVGGLLNDYLGSVESSNEPGIAQKIYDAFTLGRAAIVAKDYELRDQQAAIIKVELSKVIGYKTAYYLRSAGDHITAGNMASAFHSLSEGYGYVFSMQYTQKEDGSPYMTYDEVNTMLEALDAGNGFWDRTEAELDTMADQVDASSGLGQ